MKSSQLDDMDEDSVTLEEWENQNVNESLTLIFFLFVILHMLGSATMTIMLSMAFVNEIDVHSGHRVGTAVFTALSGDIFRNAMFLALMHSFVTMFAIRMVKEASKRVGDID